MTTITAPRTLGHTAPRVTVQDSNVAAAWGLSDWHWSVLLTDTERADYRSRVAYAPNFSTEGK